MWNAILDFFGNPWIAGFVLTIAPFIWGFFHLAPSHHKPDNPMDQFHLMYEKEKAKAIKKAQKLKAKEDRKTARSLNRS